MMTTWSSSISVLGARWKTFTDKNIDLKFWNMIKVIKCFVSAVYIGNLIRKFFQTGSVNNKKHESNHRGARSEAMQEVVLNHVN